MKSANSVRTRNLSGATGRVCTLVMSSAVLVATARARGSAYQVTNLGSAIAAAIPGGSFSTAVSINATGAVVGNYTTGSDPYANSYGQFVYMGGVAKAIDPSISDYFTNAATSTLRINDSGTVAGAYENQNGQYAAYTYIASTATATLIPSFPNSDQMTAVAINNAGTVTGAAYVTYSGSSSDTEQAYIYKNGVETNVGATFSGATSRGANYVGAINDSGQITGQGYVPAVNGFDGYIGTPKGDGSYTFVDFEPAIAAAIPRAVRAIGDGINNAGVVIGHYAPNNGAGRNQAFLYNGTTAIALTALGGNEAEAYGINNLNQTVGNSSLHSSTSTTDAFLYQNGNTQDLNNLLNAASAGWTISSAYSINDSGQIVGSGTYNGVSGAYILTPVAANLTWNNSITVTNYNSNPGITSNNNNDKNPTDGVTWDVNTMQNWNGGSITVDTIFSNGDNVTFNDSNNGHYAVTLNTTVSPGSTVVNTNNAYTISGLGGISGAGSLIKSGTGSLTMSTANNYSGGTVVSGGTLNLGANGVLPSGGSLSIGTNASVIALNHGSSLRFLLQISTLSIAGSTDSWTGKLDLNNNDLSVSGGNLATITNQLRMGLSGSGSGIYSSAAANNATHLTTLGVILNTVNGSTALYGNSGSLGLFDGTSPSPSSVLVRYTYFGDATLDGKVDGSEYSRIDNGYLSQSTSNHLTGWYNGDFNYDGVVNGSDYTLIDNAFNMQGAAFPASTVDALASVTSEIAQATAVPEPDSIAGMLSLGFAMLGRTRRSSVGR